MEEPSLVFVRKGAETTVGHRTKPMIGRDPLERLKENEKGGGINEPDSWSKRGAVGTVMPKERHEDDIYVHAESTLDPPIYCIENWPVDVIQIHAKAHQEQKDGEMQQVGNISNIQGRRMRLRPSAKYARIRARICGLWRDWVIAIYRSAHCSCNVASIAHVRLIDKLKNQSEFTQTAVFSGVNGGGLTGMEGVIVPLELARRWEMLSR
jgi:hypothetical protein